MSLVVVPDSLRQAIDARLNAEFAKLPDGDRRIAEGDRDFLFSQLVDAFDRYGEIPDFEIVPNLPEFRIVGDAEP